MEDGRLTCGIKMPTKYREASGVEKRTAVKEETDLKDGKKLKGDSILNCHMNPCLVFTVS